MAALQGSYKRWEMPFVANLRFSASPRQELKKDMKLVMEAQARVKRNREVVKSLKSSRATSPGKYSKRSMTLPSIVKTADSQESSDKPITPLQAIKIEMYN